MVNYKIIGIFLLMFFVYIDLLILIHDFNIKYYPKLSKIN